MYRQEPRCSKHYQREEAILAAIHTETTGRWLHLIIGRRDYFVHHEAIVIPMTIPSEQGYPTYEMGGAGPPETNRFVGHDGCGWWGRTEAKELRSGSCSFCASAPCKGRASTAFGATKELGSFHPSSSSSSSSVAPLLDSRVGTTGLRRLIGEIPIHPHTFEKPGEGFDPVADHLLSWLFSCSHPFAFVSAYSLGPSFSRLCARLYDV